MLAVDCSEELEEEGESAQGEDWAAGGDAIDGVGDSGDRVEGTEAGVEGDGDLEGGSAPLALRLRVTTASGTIGLAGSLAVWAGSLGTDISLAFMTGVLVLERVEENVNPLWRLAVGTVPRLAKIELKRAFYRLYAPRK